MNRLFVWLKNHRKQLGLWIGGLFLATILFSVLILPGIIKSQAEKAILKATGRTASIQKITFNPFGMTLTIQNFKLFEADRKSSFAQLGNIKVSLSSSSLFRFAPVVDELTIEKPELQLIRTSANHYNFSDIIAHLAKQPKKEKTVTPRFSINNISIKAGSIVFDDQAVSGGKQHTIRNMELSIPFISSIPYLAERYSDPKFAALINGAKFEFNGKTKPLAKSMETDLNIKLADLELPYYLPYIPSELPIKVDSGRLSIDINLTYLIYKNRKPELLFKGLSRLDDINIKERNNTPLASFKSFVLKMKEMELFSRKAIVQEIALDNLAIHAERDPSGKLNFFRIIPAGNKNDKAVDTGLKKKSAPTLQLLLESVSMTDGSIEFVDKMPENGFKAKIQAINAKLSNISTAPKAESRYEVSFNGDKNEAFSSSGTAMLSPLSVTSQFKLTGVALQRGWPYLQNLLKSPVKGIMGLEGKAAWNAQDGASVQDFGLHFKDIIAEYSEKDMTRLTALDLTGISFNHRENKASVGDIKLAGGTIKISRESDGKISPLLMLKPKDTNNRNPVEPKPNRAVNVRKTDKKPLAWQIAKVNISGLTTIFEDKIFTEPPVFKLSKINLNVSDITGPTLSKMPVTFSALYGKNAPLKLKGTVNPQPFRFKGDTSFSKLPIQDFESYIPENINVFLLGGTLDSNINLDVALGKDGKPKGSFRGKAGLRGFHVVDTVMEEDLLKWESLQLDQITGNLAPFSLSIKQIALNNVYSRIAIRKDGRLNLQNLVTKEENQKKEGEVLNAKGEEKQKDKAPLKEVNAKVSATVQQKSPEKAQIKIDALTIQDGTMDFSDAHLPKEFHTRFHNLGGRVSGLSSDMNSRAEVDLRGNLENHSPLQITGTVNPLREDLFVDLTISFKNIELSPATPYSGTYLGYEIDKGKLFLDLKYHIENKNLEASNKVFVDQFTFGNSVESDKATKLPMRLGIALLKDRKGEIHLDLPLTGRTDDPKFSIWGVVWKVVVNIFVKAATSPFALLSSMFGSGEDLSSVSFAPGSAILAPSEEKKLDTLATALNQRPGLKVELSGYVDNIKDPEGYRFELLLQKMQHEKYLVMSRKGLVKEGQTAETVVIEPSEYSTYLKTVYKKEKFPKPRNMIGMVKDLPDPEMKKLIIANTKVGKQELQQLAAKRAALVRQYLINKGKIESQRLFQKQDDPLRPPKQEKTPASRVELNPIAS